MNDWYVEEQSSHEHHSHALRKSLFRGRTTYQDVHLTESYRYGKILILDNDIQSAQYDEAYYHEILVHPAMIALPTSPRRVLILGGGEGATLREVLRYPSVESVVMVDLDGELVDICRQHMPEWSMGAFEDPRLQLIADDARAYLDRCTQAFDVILHDLPQPLVESPLRLLFTQECFARARQVLSPEGLICMQACSAKDGNNALHLLIRKTVERAFPITHTMHAFIPSFANDWGWVIASAASNPLALSQQQVDERLAVRVRAPLQYYCGETHIALFALTPAYRRALGRQSDFLQDGVPLSTAAHGL